MRERTRLMSTHVIKKIICLVSCKRRFYYILYTIYTDVNRRHIYTLTHAQSSSMPSTLHFCFCLFHIVLWFAIFHFFNIFFIVLYRKSIKRKIKIKCFWNWSNYILSWVVLFLSSSSIKNFIKIRLSNYTYKLSLS